MAGFGASEGAFGDGKKKANIGKIGAAGFKKGLGEGKKYLGALGARKAVLKAGDVGKEGVFYMCWNRRS